MARIAANNDPKVSGPKEDIHPRVPLNPTTGNGPSPSPKKVPRSAKDYYDSQEEDHSGKESPFKSPSRKLKLKQPTPGKQQRSLKLDTVDKVLLPKLQSQASVQVSPQKQVVRESPRRHAKASVNYALMQGDDDASSSEDCNEDDSDDGDDVTDNDDAQVFNIKGAKKNQKNSLFTKQFQSIPPKKSASPGKPDTGRPLPPDIFEDSDVAPRQSTSMKLKLQASRRRSSSLSSEDSFKECAAELKLESSRSQQERPATPTRCSTPPLGLSPNKLLSPSKRIARIPTPPSKNGRPSLDAFWDQGQVNEWSDIHSPRKELKFSPRKHLLPSITNSSDSEEQDFLPNISPKKSVAPGSPSKKKSVAAEKKLFDSLKQQLAQDFFKELDEKISDGEIGRLAESGGGVSLIWSKKLNSTAGRANWRREAIKRLDTATKVMTTTGYRHVASIELAEKVIENRERLYNVLAHEYCHLANFMISRVINNPHGSSFKGWASKTTKAFAKSHGVEVTTKHDYDISYKYIWVCMAEEGEGGCGTEYQRHSKSIDPTRHTCGKCKGRLVQVKPKPRGGAAGQASPAKAAGPSEYQRFVKEQFQKVKQDLAPGSPMKDVMKEIGVRYRTRKETSSTSPEKMVEIVEVADVLPSDASSGDTGSSGESPQEQDLAEVSDIARKLDFLSIGGT